MKNNKKTNTAETIADIDLLPLGMSVLCDRSPMLWELIEPCPPGNPNDFTKDPKYYRAVQSIGNSFCFPISQQERLNFCVAIEPIVF